MKASREAAVRPHVGKPECFACDGTGCDETAAEVSGDGHECGDCNGTGKTEWRTWEADEEADVCDRCAEENGDESEKPVDGATGWGECGTRWCAACYQALHDKKCGCGKAVATRRQVAEARGFGVMKGGAQ